MKFIKLLLTLSLVNLACLNASDDKHQAEKSKFIFFGHMLLENKAKLEFDLETAKVMEKTCLHDKFKQAFIDKYRKALEKVIAPGFESILLKTLYCPLINIYNSTEKEIWSAKFSINNNFVLIEHLDLTETVIDITNVNEPKIVETKDKIDYSEPLTEFCFDNNKIAIRADILDTHHIYLKEILNKHLEIDKTTITIPPLTRFAPINYLREFGRFRTYSFSPNTKYIVLGTTKKYVFLGDIEATWKVNDFNLSQILFLIELANTLRYESLNRKELLDIFETFSPEVKEHLDKFTTKIRIRNDISDITRLDQTDSQANISQLITDFTE